MELRHGVISYEDLSGWGETSNRKTIKLLFKKVRCSAVKSEQEGGRFVFALAEVSGNKRLWMADSLEELQAWVDSIKTAMIGSAGDFARRDIQEAAGAGDTESDANSGALYAAEGGAASVALRHTSQLEDEAPKKRNSIFGSSDSGSYFGNDVQRFQAVRQAFSMATTTSEYRELLHQYASESSFTVPVSCIMVGSVSCCPCCILC